jgi:hypothetical protein
MTLRALAVAVLLAIPSAARAERVTYARYRAMTEDEKGALARRYARPAGHYHRVTLRTYVVHCDAGAETAVRMAVLMDDFHRRFSAVFRRKFRVRERPALYVLKDPASYARAYAVFSEGGKAPEWATGMFVVRGKRSALFGLMSPDEAALTRVLFHEGTHQLLYGYTGRFLPVWFNEGVATNFETWEIARATDNNVANALHASGRADVAARIYPDKGYVPFRKLTAISRRAWHDAEDPGANYASAWAAVNFLLSTKGGQGFFNRLLGGYRAGRAQDTVLPPAVAADLEKRVNAYVEQTVVPHVLHGRGVLRLLRAGREDAARAAAAAMAKQYPENREAAFYRAWLDGLAGGEKTAASVAAIRALERQGFTHPELLFALAHVAARGGDAKRAGLYARQMLARNGAHAGARAILARARGAGTPSLK